MSTKLSFSAISKALTQNSMLKSTTILAMLWGILLINTRAQAQGVETYQTFVGGLVGGVSASQVDGDGYNGYNYFGFTGGGIVYFPFTNMDLPIDGTMALSMEVLFHQKGALGTTPSLGIYGQKIRLTYAEVPIQLHYYRGTRRSHIGLGLSIGYLASQEEFLDYGGGYELVKDYPFRKFDLSMVISPNIHIYKGLYIAPRYQYSMIPVRTNSGGIGRNEQFNNTVSIRLMYLFGKDAY